MFYDLVKAGSYDAAFDVFCVKICAGVLAAEKRNILAK